MNRIGVVPEQPEIVGSAHPRKPRDRLGRIGFAGGIAVFRDAPHALDDRVAGEPLDLVHVRAGPGQRYRDHLDPVLLADLEMAVVAGRGTQKARWLTLIAPRHGAVARPGQEGIDERVMHQRQARIVRNQHLFRRRAKHRRKQPASFDQSLRAAVIVAAIGAVFGPAFLRCADRRQQSVGKLDLLGRWLAACQIEGRRARLDRFVGGLLAISEFAQLFGGQAHQLAGLDGCRTMGQAHGNILCASRLNGCRSSIRELVISFDHFVGAGREHGRDKNTRIGGDQSAGR